MERKIEKDLKEITNNVNEDLILKYTNLIIDNISKQYNLDNTQILALRLNYDNLFKKYGFYALTVDDNISIKKDKMGFTYTHMINEEGINKLKLLVSDNMYINNYNCFYLENNPIFYLDLKKNLEDFHNIEVEDITKLGLYLNDLDMINKYLEILNSCDKDTKKMILDYIKPLIFYDENREDILEIFKLYHITKGYKYDVDNLQKIFKNIENQNEFMKNLKQYIKDKNLTESIDIFNFVFLSTFNDYYIRNYEQISNILQKENAKQILKKLLNIKYETLKSIPKATVDISKKAIYKKESYDVYDGDCWGNDHECGLYSTHTEYATVFSGYKYTTRFNFNEKNVISEKDALNLLLPMIINEKYDYKKLLESNQSEYINSFLNCINNEEKEKVLCK